MPTPTELNGRTKPQLLELATQMGVEAKSSMLKKDLVTLLVKASRAQSRKTATGKKKTKAKPKKLVAAEKASPKPKKKAKRASKKLTSGAAAKPTKSTNPRKPAAKNRNPKLAESSSPKKKPVSSSKKKTSKTNTRKTNTSPRALKKIRELQLQRESNKDIGFRPAQVRKSPQGDAVWTTEPSKDRIALFVRDAHWLHTTWDITRDAIERAKAAMSEQWHAATPVLRLFRLEEMGNNASETVIQDIEIHGGIRNWYLPWSGDESILRIGIGYVANDRFHAIAKSNIVQTSAAGSAEAVEEHWSDPNIDTERIFALSGGYDKASETGELQEVIEERSSRTMGAPPLARLGAGSDGPFRKRGEFHFDMEIELMVYGSTTPDAYLTLNGEPVTLRNDGTFAMRLPFPDKRQVLPAVACSRDGSQQRTIVVAVERNTKIMEPLEQEVDTGE